MGKTADLAIGLFHKWRPTAEVKKRYIWSHRSPLRCLGIVVSRRHYINLFSYKVRIANVVRCGPFLGKDKLFFEKLIFLLSRYVLFGSCIIV